MTQRPPLHGIRVTSLATNVPGPVAAARLRALGAEVLKVEPPAGDFLSQAAPGWYSALAEGQERLTIDLKSADGRTMLERRLATSDVLLLSSRPAALARLGLSREALAARFPRLCVVSIVGHHTPHADIAGHDLTYPGEAGLLRRGELPASLFSDLAAGAEATTAALALLLGRATSGTGGWTEVSLAACAQALAEPLRHGLTAPGGELGGRNPGYAMYEAADGPIAVAALEPHFMARLLVQLQLTAPDQAAMARAFAAAPAEHWASIGRTHDIPIVALTVV
jgi:crotonobetainyl-CoA:carnitine CoA-transferase CaiB-like acyl-CoA transferase